MSSRRLSLLALFVSCGIVGCQSLQSPQSSQASASASARKADSSVRNNAFALLLELLNEEKHLNKLLLVKRESDELDRLVTDISKTAGRGADMLEAMAKKDAELAQARPDLPPGEKATRDAIAKTKKRQLLGNKGVEFEIAVLLTQVEALNYAAHLSAVAAENELTPQRASEFARLSTDLKQLQERTIALLRRK